MVWMVELGKVALLFMCQNRIRCWVLAWHMVEYYKVSRLINFMGIDSSHGDHKQRCKYKLFAEYLQQCLTILLGRTACPSNISTKPSFHWYYCSHYNWYLLRKTWLNPKILFNARQIHIIKYVLSMFRSVRSFIWSGQWNLRNISFIWCILICIKSENRPSSSRSTSN